MLNLKTIRNELTKLAVLAGIFGFAALPSASADALRGFDLIASTYKTSPLQVVKQKDFCYRMTGMFINYSMNNGYSRMESVLMGNSATSALIDELRTGKAAEFVDVSKLPRLAGLKPTRTMQGLLPVTDFVAGALSIRTPALLALKVGELRFIPSVKRGNSVIVVARTSSPLTAERARKVAMVAKKSNIRISIVWIGNSDSVNNNNNDAKALAFLASVTGGVFVDLSRANDPCASIL